jgi:hypothetical protein
MIEADTGYRRTRDILQELRNNACYPIPVNVRAEIYRTWQRTTEISNIVRDLRTQAQECPPKTKSMMNLFNYLGYVESIGVALVDIGLVLLIANSKEQLQEFRKLRLIRKIQILKMHRLGYLAELIDRDLRNDIAHLKFEIDENGTIRDSSKKKRNINEIISRFWARAYAILCMFDDIKLADWLRKENKSAELSG